MSSAIEIFCCYSRKDQEMLENLKTHLAPLRRQGLITIWNDTDISPGTNYEDEIKKHLDNANIILLLVSPDFMNSDYCYSTEMERAMERHNKGEARVVPIILRPVHFKDAPFGKIQALPTDAKPVKRWTDPDDAFFDVTAEIKKIAEGLLIAQFLGEALNLFEADRFPEALESYEKALQIHPTSVAAHWGKAETLRELKRFTEALESYAQAAQVDPTIATARFYQRKGFALEALARYEDALVSYQQAINLNPNNPLLYKNKINLVLHLKRYNEALHCIDQIIRLEPDLIDNEIKKGNLLLTLKRYEEAIVVYNSLLQRNPNLAEAQEGLGLALNGLNRYEDTILQRNLNPAKTQQGLDPLLSGLKRFEDTIKASSTRRQLRAHRSPLSGLAGGFLILGIALAIAFSGSLGGNGTLFFIVTGLAVGTLLSSAGRGSPRILYSGIQSFVWLMGLAILVVIGFWPWFLVVMGISAILGVFYSLIISGLLKSSLFSTLQENQPLLSSKKRYQPSRPAHGNYQESGLQSQYPLPKQERQGPQEIPPQRQ